jgi:hypothetical protein
VKHRGGSHDAPETSFQAPPKRATRRYRPEPFEPLPDPTFSIEVLVLGGEEGKELRAAQARAIKELLTWLSQTKRGD